MFELFVVLGVFVLLLVGVLLVKKKFLSVMERLYHSHVHRVSKMSIFLFFCLGLWYVLDATFTYQYTNEFFFVVITLISSYIGNVVVRGLIRAYILQEYVDQQAPNLLLNVVSLLIYLIAGLIILARFDISIAPFLATLGVGSLAVGLALQGTLSNFFAGLRIVSEKPIQVGQYISLMEKNIEGYVEDIGWSTTRIRTIHGNDILVPNHTLVESNIYNTSQPTKDSTHLVSLGVSYDSDLEYVENVCLSVLESLHKEEEDLDENYELFVRFHSFDDSNIGLRLPLRLRTYDKRYKMTHMLVKKLKKRFDDEDIEISWPIRKVYQMHT